MSILDRLGLSWLSGTSRQDLASTSQGRTAASKRFNLGSVTWSGTTVTTHRLAHVTHIDHVILQETPPVSDIVSGEIIGYRCWFFDIEQCALRSIAYHSYLWDPINGAYAQPKHWIGYGPGIHAFKGGVTMRSQYPGFFSSYPNMHHYKSIYGYNVLPVMGTVSLWGDVFEHEFGYRAEYARPKSLYFCHIPYHKDKKLQRDIEKLRGRYNISMQPTPSVLGESPGA